MIKLDQMLMDARLFDDQLEKTCLMASNVIPVIHKPCGGIAFFYDHYPGPSDFIQLKHVVGSTVSQEDIYCNYCKKPAQAWDLEMPKEPIC